jgi:hypothetical protein
MYISNISLNSIWLERTNQALRQLERGYKTQHLRTGIDVSFELKVTDQERLQYNLLMFEDC